MDNTVATEKEADEHWLHCDMCEYKCKTNNTMLKNLSTKHASYKKCKECGQMFKSEDSLNTHMMKEHTNIKTMYSRCPMKKEHCICEWLDKAELEELN